MAHRQPTCLDDMTTFPTSPLNRSLRVVFFGTPEFAAACLETLLASDHKVIGAVTAPDRKAGRGHQLQPSAVKQTALAHNLPLLQPTNLKDPGFLSDLMSWEADVYIVVAFRMLPLAVWAAPAFGTINLHASMLPQLRGAAPIQWAIINGLESSGVTTFSLQHQIDTGDILLQTSVPIAPHDDAGQLYAKLLEAGQSLLVRTLNALAAGDLKPVPQASVCDGDSRIEAPKLHRENTSVDWTESAVNVVNKIRGLHPFPKAWTPSIHGDIKLLKASPAGQISGLPSGAAPGTVAAHSNTMVVRCGDGWIQVDELIPPGKGRMSGHAWMNGLKTDVGQLG